MLKKQTLVSKRTRDEFGFKPDLGNLLRFVVKGLLTCHDIEQGRTVRIILYFLADLFELVIELDKATVIILLAFRMICPIGPKCSQVRSSIL